MKRAYLLPDHCPVGCFFRNRAHHDQRRQHSGQAELISGQQQQLELQPKPLRDLLQAGRCIGLRDPGHGAVQLSVGDGNLVAQQDGFEQCQAEGGCRVGVDKREKKTTFFAGRSHYVFPTIVGARLKIRR